LAWLWLERPPGMQGGGADLRSKPPPAKAGSERRIDLLGPNVLRHAGLGPRRAAERIARRRAAKQCQVCGRGFPPGGNYLAGEDGDRWHKTCHEGSPRCGITGRPIPEGVPWVSVQGEAFLAGEYGRTPKCLVSGLPLVNRGKHFVNPRSGTRILADHLQRAKRCVSCRDHSLQGYLVGGVGFSCDHCTESFKRDVAPEPQTLIAEVRAFLQERGLTPPPVELFFATEKDGLTQVKRGHCETVEITFAGTKTYQHRILILSHLSRSVTLAVLTHELTHALVAIAGRPFSADDEEGFCEFAAWTYAGTHGLPAYIRRGIEENEVARYREGFLRLRARRKTLKELLRQARQL
jgi:hypothetical protein